MKDFSEFCAPGVKFKSEMVQVNNNVSLRVITFTPEKNKNNPPVVFVAGWVSLISGWKEILLEMTKDFTVYYIETREKITSEINGKVNYGVENLGKDIISLVNHFALKDNNYILSGSSLGATAILDCWQNLEIKPLCLVLIGPNAAFRVPKFGMAVVRMCQPRLYLFFKPYIKWYLKKFRLDVKNDYAQYEKYCRALDAADPWKLRNGIIRMAKYQVWDLLQQIQTPSLIVGASKDNLHDPENLHKMVSIMPNATYLDLETNKGTHSGAMVEEMRKYIAQL